MHGVTALGGVPQTGAGTITSAQEALPGDSDPVFAPCWLTCSQFPNSVREQANPGLGTFLTEAKKAPPATVNAGKLLSGSEC